jgi:hypothetical protein
VDSLRKADWGHVPGLTRQVQVPPAGGVAVLYPEVPQADPRQQSVTSRLVTLPAGAWVATFDPATMLLTGSVRENIPNAAVALLAANE